MKAPPKLMDARIFRQGPMGLKDELINHCHKDRLISGPEENISAIYR